MEIKGKNVLVTGGAVRVGRAISKAFAEKGANVFIHCNDSVEEAHELLEELGGNKHKVIRQDLSEHGAAKSIFAEAGQVDILINNASVFNLKSLKDETMEEVCHQLNINFHIPLELMKLFKDQNLGSGCIINIIDQRIAAKASLDGSYSLGKKSLAELTLCAALQWAPEIRVNGIAPGPVLPPAGMKDSKMEKTLRTVPLRRAVDMKDLTDSCIFLVENESVTGHILFVDCGQHLSS